MLHLCQYKLNAKSSSSNLLRFAHSASRAKRLTYQRDSCTLQELFSAHMQYNAAALATAQHDPSISMGKCAGCQITTAAR
jgi:hypothetical protein